MENLEERAVRGDQAAQAELMSACAGALRSRLSPSIPSKFRSLIDVDDILQVTFIDVIVNINRFESRGEGAFLAWITRLAENNLRDAVRGLERKKRQPPGHKLTGAHGSEESYTALINTLSSGGKTPTRIAREDEATRHIEAALGDLPPDYAKAVRLYDLQCMSIQEVAADMDRSQGAVHMLRARGHERLREILIDLGRFFTTS